MQCMLCSEIIEYSTDEGHSETVIKSGQKLLVKDNGHLGNVVARATEVEGHIIKKSLN